MNDAARSSLQSIGYARQACSIDQETARAMALLAECAWSLRQDTYYLGGDRFRSLNRYEATVVEGGVVVRAKSETTPYVQSERYNTTLSATHRQYAPLPHAIAASLGVRKTIAGHVAYLPMSRTGQKYKVNMHVIRSSASPGRPCDTSPPGMHKDGEKYIAVHLLTYCGAVGGEVVLADNDRKELVRFTMRESGDSYTIDDERVWHMLTPVGVAPGNEFAYRDIALFDLLPSE